VETTISEREEARIAKVIGGANSVFLGAPILADVDRIVTTVLIADGAMAIAAQPDCPRNLTAVLTDADDSVTSVVTMRGRDIQGRPVVEVMEIALGVGKSFVGTKIFAKVDSIVVSGTSGADAPATDMITVGVGDVIGLPNDIENAGEVLHVYVNGTKNTPDAIATGEGTSGINSTSATYDGAKLMYAMVKTATQS